ncbi:unnamed protein product [Larinioides sclopetarius]|uniref:[histone H3]-lysine(36) N-trimethyltransferase n=1 Tax=Larinioides sclopetarius TaxID=280406 RepID=A0AAV1YS28_9ARAC
MNCMANESDRTFVNENLLKLLNKENAMKPEKVKSRWRRNSEMEIGEKSALSLKNFEKEVKNSDINERPSLASEVKVETVLTDSDGTNPISEKKESIPLYVELEENLYLFERKRTKRKKEVRRMLCECTLTKEEREKGIVGCGDECLNRLLMIECGSRCPTGEACSNKRFQKRLYAKVQPFKTEKKGWGLKLLEDVPMGNFVIEYVGEVLSRHDFKQRVKQYAREKSNHYYFMALKTDEIIDATNKGNLSRFMNHSCDPNCETQKWTVNGELRIGFFAKRDLKTGEELTFDYQFQRYGREAQKCHCKSELCSGYIGVSNEISLDVTNKTINKRKKGSEEKKREVLEDLILEEEIEKLCENSGLRNKDETLILARLMVRAEDFHSRNKLLDVILATSEIGCLRTFVDYHGLSLLWSWMVDLTDSKLKLKILQVLSFLPVPNKTMLLESKVYYVVERWASNIHANELHGDLRNSNEISSEKNYISVTKKLKTSDTSDSETDATVFQSSESIYDTKTSCQDEKSNMDSGIGTDVSQYIEEGSINSIITSDAEESSAVNGITTSDGVSRSDEESSDAADTNKVNNSEIGNFAHNLLSSWKDLKVPILGPPPPVTQQPNNLTPCQNNHVPPSSNLIVVANMNSSPVVPTVPAVNTEPSVPTTNPVLPSSLYPPIPNSACVPVSNNFPTSSLFPPYIANPNPYSVNQNGGFYPQQQVTTHLSEQVSVQPSYTYTDINGESSVKPVPTKLPPNWKTATDSEGNIYYYHILTRQTQWDPPICDETTEDVDGDTPTYDEPPHKEHKQIETHSRRSHKKHSKKKSTTTAPADTSSNPVNSEIAKKIKELFRTKMSSFVVQCLNPYHRDDCRVGKITSNEDFKYLARKLTHFVMAKELKHCKNVEDLECNENVKHKARDFIHKYMSKYGPIYKKEKCDSPIVY